MTAFEVITGLVEKLQEENRVCLERLHKAQDVIKNYDRQFAEKNRIIKILENGLQTRTDGILETNNKQKELNVKHLEMQIQKLLKENDELELKLDTIKAGMCARCETKLLLKENDENKSIPNLYKLSNKPSSAQPEKKSVTNICPNRIKSLENIIQHKDKRITNLSKELQRLKKTEHELNQNICRLKKMVSSSRLPSETLTDCLLKEIQSLESKKQSDERIHLQDELQKLKSKSVSDISNRKVNVSNSDEKIKRNSASNNKQSVTNMTHCKAAEDLDISKVGNEVLLKKIQKLCSDVVELKHLFILESKKFSEGLNNAVREYATFSLQLEEIINNLSDIAEEICNSNYFNIQRDALRDDLSLHTDLDNKLVISSLQERLKDSLSMASEHEKRNKILIENLNCLKKQLCEQNAAFNHKKSEDRLFKSHVDINVSESDIEILKETIKIRDKQLESAQSHLNTCQSFIDQLQKSVKHVNMDASKLPCNSCEKEKEYLRCQINMADSHLERNGKLIENLQKTIKQLEDGNERLEMQLHKAKSEKMQEGIHPETVAKAKDEQIASVKRLNQELQDKLKRIEDVNSKLKTDIKTYKDKNLSLEAAEKEKDLLKAQLKDSEKIVSSLEKSVQTLNDKLQTVESKKNKLESDLKETNQLNNLAETYENDIIALKNELVIKNAEVRSLTDSLHTLENKALEMKHYRMSLHQEIEKLCKALMENEISEDSERRKAIYKAAVLHSAQALLRLDDNFNLKPEDSDRDSVLDEMKHQIEVYLTEVSRIHELVTIKEQERDQLLREYLDLDEDILRPGSSLHHGLNVQGEPVDSNLDSFPSLNAVTSLESEGATNSRTTKSARFNSDKMDAYEALSELKLVQEELTNTKSVTNYLLSSCARLENLLAQERNERAKSDRELEFQLETIKDLKCQLTMKDNMTKTLNNLIAMMRSTECNNEITLEKMKSDISLLMEENLKRSERIDETQSELHKCKEENARIQNDLDLLKRQLCNEKYENAKVTTELKRLRLQISQSQITFNSTS